MSYDSRTTDGNARSGLPLGVKIGGGIVVLLVALFVFFNLFGITRVEPGHVGVEISLAGGNRGAQEIPVRTGWVFYSPLKTQIVEFPTYIQTVKWTQSQQEGHPNDESIGFNSKEGMEVFGDFALSYALDANKVPEFYVKYRVNDMDKFTHGQLRDIVRQTLNEVGSTFTIEEIYGEKKSVFVSAAEARIRTKVVPIGIQIQNFGFIGAPRLPQQIASAIVQKTQAITEAERARNQLAVTQAEMAKIVAESEGYAKSAVAKAQGEAEANRLRTQSITPAILEMKRLENEFERIKRWKGDVPQTVLGGDTKFLMSLPQTR